MYPSARCVASRRGICTAPSRGTSADGSASVIASIINPVVGLSTFLAQLILRGPLVNAATQEFMVDGTWLEPRMTKVERR